MIGFINIIKPTGVSSGLIVNKLKRLTGEKVGHLGTLDPAATGVLTLAIGKATRFFDYFLKKDKEYIALAKFGVLTDTLDSYGEIVDKNNIEISINDVQRVARNFIGEIEQLPPIYSSKNINGKRAYDLARSGVDVELQPKKVQIYDIKVEKTTQDNLFKLKIHCSSGTYVRSIIRDIAQNLNTVATTVCIIRTKSGMFRIEDACTFDEIQSDLKNHLIPIADVLQYKKITISQKCAKDLSDGKMVKCDQNDGEYLLIYQNREFATAECLNGLMKKKIFLFEGDING